MVVPVEVIEGIMRVLQVLELRGKVMLVVKQEETTKKLKIL